MKSDWVAAEVECLPSATEANLEECETRLGSKLDPNLRVFYTFVGGMGEGELDPSTQIRIWPLSELELVDGLLTFADFLIWSHSYSLDQDGNVVITEAPGTSVASTFSEFLFLMSTDPGRLVAGL